MARFGSRLLFGFHGCDREVGRRLLDGSLFKPSRNDYDWLGEGIYFWEGDPKRAYEYARDTRQFKQPFVVGAVIDAGECLDLSTRFGLESLRVAYDSLCSAAETAHEDIPRNMGPPPLAANRQLDRAVIEMHHMLRKLAPRHLPPVDVVRAPFIEGDDVYPGASFKKENHIQLCVRNADCILGVFRLGEEDFH